MPNEKKHFTTGAVVGATVNFIIQSAKMAMDYEPPFDWNQFFLCAGAGAFATTGPRLCQRPAAEIWNGSGAESATTARSALLRLLTDTLQSATGYSRRNASLPLPNGEGGPALRSASGEGGGGEGEGSARKPTGQDPEIVAPPTPRQLFRAIISTALIAYSLSSKHTSKLSRTSSLYLWSFGIGYLSYTALGSTTVKRFASFFCPHLFAASCGVPQASNSSTLTLPVTYGNSR
jgi:hypothetical protein